MIKRLYIFLLCCCFVCFAGAQKMPVKTVVIHCTVRDSMNDKPLGDVWVTLLRPAGEQFREVQKKYTDSEGNVSLQVLVTDTATVEPAYFPLRVSRPGYALDSSSLIWTTGETKKGVTNVTVRALMKRLPDPVYPAADKDKKQRVTITGIIQDSIPGVDALLSGVTVTITLDDSLVLKTVTLENGRFASEPMWLTVGQALRLRAQAEKKGYREISCTSTVSYSSTSKDGGRTFIGSAITVKGMLKKEGKVVRIVEKKDD